MKIYLLVLFTIISFVLADVNNVQAEGELLENILVSASSPENLSEDDLTCSYRLTGTSVTAATAWYRNGQPLMSLYMPFEGGTANALLDYSGNGNVGIDGGGVTWNVSGGHDGNGAFEFDGSKPADINAGSVMPIGAYTKVVWLKLASGGNNNIMSGDGGHVFWAPGSSAGRLSAGHNGSWQTVRDSGSLQFGIWYFVAVTYDPDVNGGEMKLYRDGVMVDSSVDVPLHSPPNQTVWVGAYKSSNNMNGTMDDIRLYDHALPPEQIWALYSSGQDLIVFNETEVGDVWQADVTPFSAVDKGAIYQSGTLTIQAGLGKELTGITVAGPASVDERGNAAYTCTASYSDGTSSLVVPVWDVTCPLTADISGTGELTTGEVDADTACTVTASYAKSGVVETDTYAVIILDQPLTGPGVENVLLSASSPDNLAADDLVCSYTLPGESVTAATAWYRNGQPLMSLYMPFEGETVNALLDYSGNESVGIDGGGLTWNASAGHDGNGAFEFDGSTAAEINAGTVMPLNAYTKTAWVKLADGGFNNIVSGDGGHAFWAPGSSSGRLSAGHNGSWQTVKDGESLQFGTWYFVAVTYDPNSNGGEMKLYKNGVMVDSAVDVPLQNPPSRTVWVGAYNSKNNMNGILDDVRLYNHALTPEQIWALYSSGQDLIVSSETATGDWWQANVTPFSAVDKGAVYTSSVLTVEGRELTSIRIDGPARVDESGSADYTCTSSYSDGTSSQVVPVWDVTCPLAADISATGTLTTRALGANEPCTVTASYTEKGITLTDSFSMTIMNEVVIMPLGDSITLGVYSEIGGGYRRFLDFLLNGAGYNFDFTGSLSSGPFDFDNDHEGHLGWEVDEIRDNIYGWLVDNPAEIILLHIGTNDIRHSQNVTDIVTELEQLLDNIDQYEIDSGSDITVFLSLIINVADPNSQQGADTSLYNDLITSMAQTRTANGDSIILVDQEPALIYPDDLADSVHPNDSGYEKMANTWFDELNLFLPSL